MNRSLVLQLNGTFSACGEDGAEIAGLSRRGQAMLAYLSQQRDMRAERGLLADLMWSDRGEDQARASLRQELSLLRKVLPSGIVSATRQYVTLDQGKVEIDRSVSGDFLQGFDLQSEGFEDWLRDIRSADRDADAEKETPPEPNFFSRPAVLLFAFEAISSGEQDVMIATGLADDLRTTLSYWRWFPVIGPDAIGWKTAKEVDLRAVTAEVGAAYAVTGSLRCIGNRIRITVGLTEAATGLSKWSEVFDGTMDDIFDFQEEVSRAIVAQLEPQIAHAEAARVARLHPSTLVPWQLVAQADEIDRKGGAGYGSFESNEAQAKLMQRALELDPEFSVALTRLARIHFRAALGGWSKDRDESFMTSLEYSRRALEIDPDDYEAHAYHGLVQIFGYQDYVSGTFHGAEAVRLNPSAAIARHAASCGLEWNGQADVALSDLNLIFRLNPNYNARAAVLGQLTTCSLIVGDRDSALEAANQLLAISKDYPRGLQRCVSTFGYFDEPERAAQALKLLMQTQPDFDEAYVRETYPYSKEEDLEAFLTGLRKAGAI